MHVSFVAGHLINALLPPRCVVTGDIVDKQGMVAPAAWESLRFITDPYCRVCGIPFEFETVGGAVCAVCLAHPPPYSAARGALAYDDVSRDMILRFKHADQTDIVHSFVPWLMRAGAEMMAQADILVPVPLHRWRLFRRRYNQSALIAGALSKVSGKPHIPDALRRIRATPMQGKLNFSERQKNVRRAFSVDARHAGAIAGKRIVLIDDVYTTGATVKECTKALLTGGAADVCVLAVARVVRAEDIF